MVKASNCTTELTVLRNYFWLLLVLWTVLVGGVLLLSLYHQSCETENVARIEARDSLEKDLLYRRWASEHGGLYVPVSETTRPNPHLSHIEEREIRTESGRLLTLVNPAYMTRQVYEMGLDQYGLQGHITSLNPLRPENSADEWERQALLTFEEGVEEVSSVSDINNESYMRLMRPMITEESCLKCHEGQGYKVGDLRGGISVAVPMAPLRAVARGHALILTGSYFLLWLLGVCGISVGGQGLKRRIKEGKLAEAETVSLSRFPSENPNPIFRIDRSGELLYANNSSESLLSLWSCSVGEMVPEVWRETVSDVFANGSSRHLEKEYSGRTYSFMMVPIATAGYVNLYASDITKRSEAEEALSNSEKKYRQITESIETILWEYDILADSWTYLSPQLERLLGYVCEDWTDLSFWVDHIYEDDRQWVSNYCAGCMSCGESHKIEYRFLKKNGEVVWLLDVANVELQDGIPVKMRGFMSDISDRKQVESDLHNAYAELDLRVQDRTAELTEANASLRGEILKRKRREYEIRDLRDEFTHIARVSAMGELTASLAHELKQPLAAIRSNAQAAQHFLSGDKPDIDELHEVLKDIIDDNRRADDVIVKLRNMMRKSERQNTDLNLNDIVRDILPLVHSYEIMRNVSLDLYLDKTIPSVNGDRTLLQQVILNLILNSTEALMDGASDSYIIAIRTGLWDRQSVILSISDNGPGIDEEDMVHLFEPFYTTKKEGLGMGLAISRSIVEQHEGRLWVENNSDGGVTFYFTIPISNGGAS